MMARRKQGIIETFAFVPWPIGIIVGVTAWLGIRWGIGVWLSSSGGTIGKAFAGYQGGSALAPLAWIALSLCWFGALLSFLGGVKRKRLLAAQTGLDSLRAMSWREFEMLVGEAFRQQGYAVEETGLGGADGGIDLILRKGGAATLVQCKQWRAGQVGVKVVREMYGLMAHHGAAAAKIVAIGNYTAEAERFARGKPIELIDREALIAMVREAQATALPDGSTSAHTITGETGIPACPKCAAPMSRRANRRTGEQFWGCPNYPACRGTRDV
ncbi:MAG: restriction endonuclease [Rhodanobacteraceae bacterium]